MRLPVHPRPGCYLRSSCVTQAFLEQATDVSQNCSAEAGPGAMKHEAKLDPA